MTLYKKNMKTTSDILSFDDIIKKDMSIEQYKKQWKIKDKELLEWIYDLHNERDELLSKINKNNNFGFMILGGIIGGFITLCMFLA